MTRDDILRMAREAGWSGIYAKPLMSINMSEDVFFRFVARVEAEKEQEMLAEGWVLDFPPPKGEVNK